MTLRIREGGQVSYASYPTVDECLSDPGLPSALEGGARCKLIWIAGGELKTSGEVATWDELVASAGSIDRTAAP